MSNRFIDWPPTVFGARAASLARRALVLAAPVLLAAVALGGIKVVLAALAASWLLFAGLAAGGVALSAAIRVTQGRWARPILPVAEAASGFLAPSLVVLVVLVGAARVWIPRLAEQGLGAWLWLGARDIGSAAALLVAARRYVRGSRSEAPDTMRRAVVYLIVYVVALTFWAIDLVMALSDSAPSTVIPPFYFTGALLSAVAWVALVTSWRGAGLPPDDTRVNLARLLFGLSVLWAYLLWSGYLPVWYANLPDETGMLLARWTPTFRPISLFVIAAVFVLPFAILMPGSAKHHPKRVALGAASILAGMTGERFLLVLPSLEVRGTGAVVAAVGATLGLLGAFVLATGAEFNARRRRSVDPRDRATRRRSPASSNTAQPGSRDGSPPRGTG